MQNVDSGGPPDIGAILDTLQSGPRRRTSEVRRDMLAVVTADVLMRGRFLQAGGDCYMVIADRLIPLRTEADDLQIHLSLRGLPPSSRAARDLVADLRVEARKTGVRLPIAVFSQLDVRSRTLRLLGEDGSLAKVGLGEVATEANGSMLVVQPSRWGTAAAVSLPPPPPDGLLRLLSGIKFGGTQDEAHAGQMAVVAACVAAVAPELLHAMPVIVLTGQAAAALRLVEVIGTIVGGPRFCTILPCRERDVIDLLASTPIIGLEVQDRSPRWLAPLLQGASRRTVLRRDSAGTLTPVPTRALPIVVAGHATAIDPALATRAVWLEIGGVLPETLLEALAARDLVMSELVCVAQRVLAQPIALPTPFSGLIDRVEAALGGRGTCSRHLPAAAPSRKDPDTVLLHLLRSWTLIDSNPGRRVSASVLFSELTRLARGQSRDFPLSSVGALAQGIRRLQPQLEQRLGLQIHHLRSRGRELSFHPVR